MSEQADLFEAVVELPDRNAQRRYDALVGLDETKALLGKEAHLLLRPDELRVWSKQFHGVELAACNAFTGRSPMFLFAGDVGTGKTELAETFGDELARSLDMPVLLYRLSLSSRGSGAVGEMTQLLSKAFAEVISVAASARGRTGIVLVIDEADALAQSREASQMHHEDRAGVNALIRGINSLAERQLPVLIVLATNRVDAIDPAVRRRAAATFVFDRPNDQQRKIVFERLLAGVQISKSDLERLVAATGRTETRWYGYTYSDLRMRVVPAAVLRAFPDRAIDAEMLFEVLRDVAPSPPFVSQQS